MRVVVRNRFTFLAIAIVTYILGFQFLPETSNYNGTLISIMPESLAICGYFVVLPLLYWILIIKAGKQKAWKMLIILSTSSAMARYSFPANIAQYFEFVVWIKYPLTAILLAVEFYLVYTIIKGLWQARTLSGDPRIHVLTKYKDDDKKLTLALPLAWEPASWYYAISRFSKNHQPNITPLNLLSASRLHYVLLLGAILLMSLLSYLLIVEWNEIVAIIVAGFFFYGIVFLTANYRISKYYSLYIKDEQLVINNAFLGFMVVNLNSISGISFSENIKENNEILVLGRGEKANLELIFNSEQVYISSLGMFVEKVNKIRLVVAEPEELMDIIRANINTQDVKLAS